MEFAAANEVCQRYFHGYPFFETWYESFCKKSEFFFTKSDKIFQRVLKNKNPTPKNFHNSCFLEQNF